MKLFFKILFIVVFLTESSFAETFNAALKRAYETNPELCRKRKYKYF